MWGFALRLRVAADFLAKPERPATVRPNDAEAREAPLLREGAWLSALTQDEPPVRSAATLVGHDGAG